MTTQPNRRSADSNTPARTQSASKGKADQQPNAQASAAPQPEDLAVNKEAAARGRAPEASAADLRLAEQPDGPEATDAEQGDSAPAVLTVDQILINPQLQALDRQVTDQERSQMEQEIRAANAYSKPFEVWRKTKMLLADYVAFAICMEHEIPCTFIEKDFEGVEAVEIYLADARLSQGSLVKFQYAEYLRGRLYEAHVRQGERNDQRDGQTDHKLCGTDRRKTTAQDLASRFNLGEATIRREAQFAKNLDIVVENSSADVRTRCFLGQLKVSYGQWKALAGMRPHDMTPLVQVVLETGKFPKTQKPNLTALQKLEKAWGQVKDEQDRRVFLNARLKDDATARIITELLDDADAA